MNLMFAPLRKYADFQGRARRTEYWLFALFRACLLIAFVAVIGVIAALSETGRTSTADPTDVFAGGLMLLGLALYLALFIPTLAVTVRRLHDTGQSGWLILLNIVPFGGIVIFVFTVLNGNSGRNTYGVDPKATAVGAASIFS